jgi:hypothetical protein
MTAAGQKVGIFALLRAKAGQRFKALLRARFLTQAGVGANAPVSAIDHEPQRSPEIRITIS